MRLFTLIFLPILLITTIDGARILAVLPGTPSHYILCRKVITVLAERGHEIVAIIPKEDGKLHANIKEITMGVVDVNNATNTHPAMLIKEFTFTETLDLLWTTMNAFVDYVTHNATNIKNFVETDKSHFDLVIAEEFFAQAFYGFAHKYSAPLVLISTFGSAHFINEYTGNALEPSYVAHEFSDIFNDLSFYERAKNLFYVTYDLIGRKMKNVNYQNGIAQRLFKDPTMPHVSDLERNAAVVFINTHYSMSMNQPFLPNIVQIGGLHIEETKPLEPSFKQILDNAKDGAIIFSLGSIMDLSYQPDERVIGILKALARFKQAVFIKYNSDKPLPVKFSNIYNFNWMPQSDILAHPNTIAFVTHGGLGSTLEAVHHGVPIVCVPFFGDQRVNCLKSEALGYGVVLKKSELNEENLYQKLNEVITNSKYKMAAKEMSKRFRDRPVSPKDQVVYWTEYVLRHNGSDFMKGPKRNLYWYQILYLDIIALIFLVCWLVKKLVGKVLSTFFSSKKANVKRKVKRN